MQSDLYFKWPTEGVIISLTQALQEWRTAA